MPTTDAARTVARQKLAGLFPGQTGLNVADEIADAITAAIEAHIREQVAQQLHDQNPDRDADFTAGVDWAIDTIRSN